MKTVPEPGKLNDSTAVFLCELRTSAVIKVMMSILTLANSVQQKSWRVSRHGSVLDRRRAGDVLADCRETKPFRSKSFPIRTDTAKSAASKQREDA